MTLVLGQSLTVEWLRTPTPAVSPYSHLYRSAGLEGIAFGYVDALLWQ